MLNYALAALLGLLFDVHVFCLPTCCVECLLCFCLVFDMLDMYLCLVFDMYLFGI